MRSQAGCLSLEQGRACGMSSEQVKRRLRTGRWERALPRVYAVSGSTPSWDRSLFAAVLWVGGNAAVSGAAAAALWELPGFSPGAVEVSHSGAKRGRRGVTVRRVPLEPGEIRRLRGLPVTAPSRTLFDVAGRLDGDAFDTAFHHCLHAGLVTLDELEGRTELLPPRGFPGAGAIRRALASYGGGSPAGSPLEARVSRQLTASGLPPPEQQHEVRVHGRRRYLDFAWPPKRTALEVDGYRWHSSRSAWERDRRRLADLRRAGWTIVHVTYDDVTRRWPEVVRELSDLLR